MKQKVIRAGLHSLAVIIPAPFIHALGIKKGDSVEVATYQESGKVMMKFHGAIQLPLVETSKKKVIKKQHETK